MFGLPLSLTYKLLSYIGLAATSNMYVSIHVRALSARADSAPLSVLFQIPATAATLVVTGLGYPLPTRYFRPLHPLPVRLDPYLGALWGCPGTVSAGRLDGHRSTRKGAA